MNMKTEIKRYVEFFSVKDFVLKKTETSIRKIESGEQVEVPKKAFAYRFFDRQEAVAEDGEILSGKPRNYSGMNYIGRILTLEDLKREMPYEKIQIKNMERKKLENIVLARERVFRHLEEGDKVIEDKSDSPIYC